LKLLNFLTCIHCVPLNLITRYSRQLFREHWPS